MTTTRQKTEEVTRIFTEAREAVRRIKDDVDTIYRLMAGELQEEDGLPSETKVMATDFATSTDAWFEKLERKFEELHREIVQAVADGAPTIIPTA